MSSARERRQFYRVRFPLKARPTLRIGTRSYAVTELSEGGLRLLKGDDLKDSIQGRLIFSDGRSQEVTGDVLRQENETIVYKLEGVTFADMMEEQRRLVRIYPFMEQF